MKRLLFIILFLAGTGNLAVADTTMTVSSLDYRIYLPDNWIMKVVNDSQHIFYDTAADKAALISIVRYHINRTTFPAANDWQRASFIAYMMVAEYSYDPWGAIFYYDSSATCTQQNYWAPEIYAEYYTLDTALDSWAEYVRYTSTNSYGYELFAIGDTLELATNIGLYAGIIRLMQLEVSTAPVRYTYERRPVLMTSHPQASTQYLYTVTGKKITGTGKIFQEKRVPVGVYCSPGKKRTLGLK